MSQREHKPLLRSLGEFWGHVWTGATRKVDGARRVEVRREVEEARGATDVLPGAEVTLRRTTIEEIEVRSPREPG
jgi:hypothetical protein